MSTSGCLMTIRWRRREETPNLTRHSHLPSRRRSKEQMTTLVRMMTLSVMSQCDYKSLLLPSSLSPIRALSRFYFHRDWYFWIGMLCFYGIPLQGPGPRGLGPGPGLRAGRPGSRGPGAKAWGPGQRPTPHPAPDPPPQWLGNAGQEMEGPLRRFLRRQP